MNECAHIRDVSSERRVSNQAHHNVLTAWDGAER
jgi:hypothetical protein